MWKVYYNVNAFIHDSHNQKNKPTEYKFEVGFLITDRELDEVIEKYKDIWLPSCVCNCWAPHTGRWICNGTGGDATLCKIQRLPKDCDEVEIITNKIVSELFPEPLTEIIYLENV